MTLAYTGRRDIGKTMEREKERKRQMGDVFFLLQEALS